MAVTRIKNNQITDLTVNAAAKLQDFSVTSAKLANDFTYGSNFTITGNLTVQGNVTAIDTEDLVVEDPLILLAKDQTGSPSLDIGFIGKRGTDDNIAWIWDESADEFAAVFTTSEITNTTVNINSYASIHALDITAANLDISGNITFSGLIDGNITVSGNVDADNFNANSKVTADSGEFVANASANNFNATTSVTAVTLSASGNVNGNNAVITNDVSAASVTASGNVGANNVNATTSVTAVTLSASGNVNGNNAVITNNVSAATGTFSGNVGANNFNATTSVTAVTISASGNVSGNNAVITNDVSAASVTASGNVGANNVNATTSVTAVTISASGNLEGNNAVIINDVSATTGSFSGNVSGVTWLGNVEGTYGDFTGNVDANNINATTSVTAVTLSASGNVESGNVNASGVVTATDVVASGNVDAQTAVNTNLISGTSVAIVSSGDLDLQPSGNIDVSGVIITNMGTPVLAFDAATKQYVDDAVSAGIHIHTPVQVETPTALPSATYAQGGTVLTVTDTVAGNTVVFSTAANLQVNDQLWFANSFNGIVGNLAYFVVSAPNTSAAVLSTAYSGVPVSNITSGSSLTQSVRVNSGVGATLTAAANGALVVDGVSLSNNDRVLVYQQAQGFENGVYDVTDAGNVSAPWILTRSSDADTYEPQTSTGLDNGSYFYVQEGDTGAGESYVKTEPAGPFIFGLANIVFTQFSASQVYSANTNAGLDLTGTVFSAKVDNNTTAFDLGGNISVKAGANLTTPNIGNATGNSLTLSGTGLLSATTVNVTGNVVAANITSNAAVNGVTIAASGNLEGNNAVVTNNVSAASVTASGNVGANNVNATTSVTAVTVAASGNVSANNAVITNDVSAATGSFSGNVTANNFNATTSVTAATISASGNISANNAVITNDVSAISGSFTGNVSANNVIASNLVSAIAVEASGNLAGNNAIIETTVESNNVVALIAVSTPNLTSTGGLSITTGSNGNITLNPDGTGVVILEDETANRMLFTGANKEIATDGNATFDGANLVITGSFTTDNVVVNGDNITSLGSELTINAAGADVNFRVAGDTDSNLFIVDAGSDSVLIGTASPTTDAALKIGTTDSILIPVGNTLQRPATPVTGMVRFNTTLDNLEFYDADGWTTAGSLFTIITADEFNGDGSTVQFTLSEDSTTAATIVSINGVVQQPVTSYAVSGNVLTFTEAPESTDVIDTRILTTTATVSAFQNTSGNAVIEASETSADIVVTGNLKPSGNLQFNLGSPTAQWKDLYLGGNSLYLGNIILKENAGNLRVRNFDDTADAVVEATFLATSISSGNLQIGGNHIESTNVNGNIELSPNGNGAIVFNKDVLNGQANGTGNIGSSTSSFNTIFAKATSAQYADLAELYTADQSIEPGTVVAFGGENEVQISNIDADRRVAGVISTNPSYIMNSILESEHVVTVALTGRVPTRVQGAVRKGDMMVSAGNGRARAEADPVLGSVIGKALSDFDGDEGVIEVVIGRL